MRASGYVSAQGETAPIAVPYDDAGKPLPVERVTRYNAADLAHATARIMPASSSLPATTGGLTRSLQPNAAGRRPI